MEEEQDEADSDKEVEHKPPCGRCASLNKVCTGLPNRMCNACQKSKGKCNKSSGHEGKGGTGEEKEGQGARYVITGLRSTHTDKSSARPASKIHKKGSTCEMIEVSDDDEPGPSRGRAKHIVTMPVCLGASRKPVTWSQVVVLEVTMHNTVGQMQAMEVDVHSILGWMRGMESGGGYVGEVGRDEGGSGQCVE